MNDIMPKEPITILLITKDDHIFTGTAYMYTLETTTWEDKVQELLDELSYERFKS